MGFLRKLFGPSQDEIWTQLAQEINADYVTGSWKEAKAVRAHVGEWTVTLDAQAVMVGKVVVQYTRLRAPYVNRDGFRFKIYRKSTFSGLGKMMGMQDVEIGDPFFDDEFIIQGTDETKLRALFANDKIRELIKAQPDIHLEVKDDEGWFSTTFPEGVDELAFQASGVITDLYVLKQLFTLFAEILNQLCVIGSAYDKDPHVQL